MKTVACHQPNFIPWYGFFKKVAVVDVFVLLDDVEVTRDSRQNFINRVRFANQNGPFWSTVPTLRSSGSSAQIRELELDDRQFNFWRGKFLKMLSNTYGFGDDSAKVIEIIDEALNLDGQSLVRLNLGLLQAILRHLEIDTELVLSSSLAVSQSSSERLACIAEKLRAERYLSGQGGKNYLDMSVFESRGITVQFEEGVQPTYPQRNTQTFQGGLSVLDMIFNVGFSATRESFY